MSDTVKSAPDLERVIDRALESTIQSEPTAPLIGGGILPVFWRTAAGLYLPLWWSPARDRALRNFWKKSDHLSGAIYNLQAKMTAIPFKIVARDPSNQRHAREAERWTRELFASAQFGEGWPEFFAAWLEDLFCTDNGAFAEIVGPGDPAGPLTGPPVTIAHLDSSRCQRTGNATYPVIYTDVSGKIYKLHRTRVLYKSQMTSPIADMYGVGFCAVSRCVNITQTLVDILIFKQEKLGSRPHRAILITKGGLDPTDIQTAFQMAESELDNQRMSRYSKIVVAGSGSLTEAGLDVVELSELPDGFDEQTSVTLGMATIALALGVDARELFPAMQAGATRADALLQHLKQRGKGPGQIIQMVETAMNYKYLPSYLEMVFDFQDDAQDRQAADTKKVRADRRVQDMATRSLTPRIMREQMVGDGDLQRSQFEQLELADGRLPDGACVLALFYSEDPKVKELLDLGVDDPLAAAEIAVNTGAQLRAEQEAQQAAEERDARAKPGQAKPKERGGPPKAALPSFLRLGLRKQAPEPEQAGEQPDEGPALIDPTQPLRALILERLVAIQKVLLTERDPAARTLAFQCQAALIYLEKYLDNPAMIREIMLGQAAAGSAASGPAYVDGRMRTVDLTNPNTDEELDQGDEDQGTISGTHRDDRPNG
jgi:hypothetical protein